MVADAVGMETMTNMKMISPIKADEDVGGGKDNDTNQR
jgi:hypothetical protein